MSGLSRRREGPTASEPDEEHEEQQGPLSAADLLKHHGKRAQPTGDAEERRKELLERHRPKRGKPSSGEQGGF